MADPVFTNAPAGDITIVPDDQVNQKLIINLDAIDPDSAGPVTFSISGPDAGSGGQNAPGGPVRIAEKTGSVYTVFNFDDLPPDADGDGFYEITVTATDSDGETTSFDLRFEIKTTFEFSLFVDPDADTLNESVDGVVQNSQAIPAGGVAIDDATFNLFGFSSAVPGSNPVQTAEAFVADDSNAAAGFFGMSVNASQDSANAAKRVDGREELTISLEGTAEFANSADIEFGRIGGTDGGAGTDARVVVMNGGAVITTFEVDLDATDTLSFDLGDGEFDELVFSNTGPGVNGAVFAVQSIDFESTDNPLS